MHKNDACKNLQVLFAPQQQKIIKMGDMVTESILCLQQSGINVWVVTSDH